MILYDNGIFSFILLSEGLFIGSKIFSGISFLDDNYRSLGSSNILLHLNLFSIINSIELKPNNGFKLARSAGVSAVLVSRDNYLNKVIIKLRSGWLLKISLFCMCCLGQVSNYGHNLCYFKKAGQVRALGFRPIVRGVIKNPCDHPHGGGEGRGSPPRAQVSPWGHLTKGTPTKNKKIDRLNRYYFKQF